jgi:hypothetical protein
MEIQDFIVVQQILKLTLLKMDLLDYLQDIQKKVID